MTATPVTEPAILDSTDEYEDWVSAIAIPESTPPIKIKMRFLAALPKFSGKEGEGPWGFLNRFMTVCGQQKRQAGVPEEIFRMATFPYCLTGEARRWFKGIPHGSITTWAELRMAFLRQYADQEELEAPLEAYLNWSIARAKWAKSDLGMDPLHEEEMPTLEAEVRKVRQAHKQQTIQGCGSSSVGQATELDATQNELEDAMATHLMWGMAKAQILEGKLEDPIFEKEWNHIVNVKTIEVRQDREQQAVGGSSSANVGQASEAGKTTSTTRGRSLTTPLRRRRKKQQQQQHYHQIGGI